MKLAPVPVPLPPASGIGSPKTWDNRSLVRMQGPDGAGTDLKGVALFDGTTYRTPVTFEPVSTVQLLNETEGAEFRFVGNVFEQAVKEARASAFASQNQAGAQFQSAAVLQGANGRYYVAALGNWYRKDGNQIGTTGSSIDKLAKRHGPKPIDVTALHPDVKAVVDRNSWVDLRAGGAAEIVASA